MLVSRIRDRFSVGDNVEAKDRWEDVWHYGAVVSVNSDSARDVVLETPVPEDDFLEVSHPPLALPIPPPSPSSPNGGLLGPQNSAVTVQSGRRGWRASGKRGCPGDWGGDRVRDSGRRSRHSGLRVTTRGQ